MTTPKASESVRPTGRAHDATHRKPLGAAFLGLGELAQAGQDGTSLCESADAQAGVEPAAPQETLDPGRSLTLQTAELCWLDRQLSQLGAEILTEPIPEFLLRALSQLHHRYLGF
jgi:hypothetical protein